MVINGYGRVNPPSSDTDDSDEENEVDWRFIINNERLHQITKTESITQFYQQQQVNWMAHLIRRENDNVGKILTFHQVQRTKRGRISPSILDRAVSFSGMDRAEFIRAAFNKDNIIV